MSNSTNLTIQTTNTTANAVQSDIYVTSQTQSIHYLVYDQALNDNTT